MNTPKPCDSCTHLYSNVLYEDDPNSSAECNHPDPKAVAFYGNFRCPYFKHWELENVAAD